MPMTEPCDRFTEDDFDIFLEACWEQIALFAYTQCKAAGRGMVMLERQGLEADILHDQVDLGYAVYEPGRPDVETAQMIEEYDSEWEIVFQYLKLMVTSARCGSGPHPATATHGGFTCLSS